MIDCKEFIQDYRNKTHDQIRQHRMTDKEWEKIDKRIALIKRL